MSESLTITGVPPAVTRAQVMEALRVLGIDAGNVVSFGADANGPALHVEVTSDLRPRMPGRPYRWADDRSALATHRLTIPILKEDPST